MEKRSTKPDTGAYVSPYLRRPLRSFEQFAQDQAARTVISSHLGINVDRMDDRHRNGSDDAKPNL